MNQSDQLAAHSVRYRADLFDASNREFDTNNKLHWNRLHGTTRS